MHRALPEAQQHLALATVWSSRSRPVEAEENPRPLGVWTFQCGLTSWILLPGGVLKGRGRVVAAADVEPDANTEAVTLNLTL